MPRPRKLAFGATESRGYLTAATWEVRMVSVASLAQARTAQFRSKNSGVIRCRGRLAIAAPTVLTFGLWAGPSRNRRSRRGVASVELAVLVPFLAFLFVIALDFGRIFYFSVTVENCARSGALYGSDPVAAAQSPYSSIQQA